MNLKLVVGLLGLLTVAIGLWPLIQEFTFIPEIIKFVPTSGMAYQSIIIAIGLVGLLYAFKKGKNVKIK